jgi:hypothetical protein
MTALPTITICEPDHPMRTPLRIAFWLVAIALLALIALAVLRGDSTRGATRSRRAGPVHAEVRARPMPKVSPVRTVTHAVARPRPVTVRPRHVKPTPATPARHPGARVVVSQRNTLPARPSVSRPVRPAPTKPAPTPAKPGADPTPPPRPSGGSSTTPAHQVTPPQPVAPAPATPKPPSAHNCDVNNEAC